LTQCNDKDQTIEGLRGQLQNFTKLQNDFNSLQLNNQNNDKKLNELNGIIITIRDENTKVADQLNQCNQ